MYPKCLIDYQAYIEVVHALVVNKNNCFPGLLSSAMKNGESPQYVTDRLRQFSDPLARFQPINEITDSSLQAHKALSCSFTIWFLVARVVVEFYHCRQVVMIWLLQACESFSHANSHHVHCVHACSVTAYEEILLRSSRLRCSSGCFVLTKPRASHPPGVVNGPVRFIKKSATYGLIGFNSPSGCKLIDVFIFHANL
ncbi:hypothetical protein DBV15_10146 [Temnothorax longispinosus]|uniref:Uncharacterized protein n=1 Tax=Temnothorax longispinosus TaxID=300112 RepID=A0A4S2KV49_9HYME|nr:hypothetical protein DBV15_10146 [Temnothorax longispinosus]